MADGNPYMGVVSGAAQSRMGITLEWYGDE